MRVRVLILVAAFYSNSKHWQSDILAALHCTLLQVAGTQCTDSRILEFWSYALHNSFYYIWSLLRGGDRLDVGFLLSSTFGVIPRYDSWGPVYAFLIVYNKKKREFKKQNRWNFNEISCFVLFTRPPREIQSLLWVRFRIICYEQKALLAAKRTQKIRVQTRPRVLGAVLVPNASASWPYQESAKKQQNHIWDEA